jgi:hypothetical integral membrane protein (TIGR02206 family)
MSVQGPPPFVLLGADHLAALAMVAAGAALWIILARQVSDRAGSLLRHTAAVALAAAFVSELVAAGMEGRWTLEVFLPLQLCDINAVLAVVSLLTLNPRTSAVLYFFALAGTLPAMITPELPVGFPAFRFLVYFATHGLVVSAALVIVFGFRLLPCPRDFLRAFLALNIYAGLIALVNLALNTNYLYLRRKPVSPTPLDVFGPWPYYLVTLEFAFLVVFFLLDVLLRPLRRRSRVSSPSGSIEKEPLP